MAPPSPPPTLQISSDMSNNWNDFENKFRKYINDHQPPECSSAEQVIILLNVIGEQGLLMINQLNLTEPQLKNINEVIEALRTQCTSEISQQRSEFHQRAQQDDESFDDFLRHIQELAVACDFGQQKDAMLLERIRLGIRDVNTQQQLTNTKALTLVNAISMCRIADILKFQSMEATNSAVLPRNKSEYFNSSSTECVLQPASAVSMNIENPLEMQSKHMCGISTWHPIWLQKFANSQTFLAVYGLLGTIQSMAFLYFMVTLTTMEKRFKIPSQTTGIIISGNEISQILLSLILSYVGGQRNRPRWLAWGIVFCALSCFILALPHFIYGPGDDALHLTAEYVHRNDNISLFLNSSAPTKIASVSKLCVGITEEEECNELFSFVPLVLIFLSQFVLGIGNTLYFALGQTYLDDNTKKTNTPMMLAYAMSLRMCGPVVGFLLGYVSLNMYIDPTKTPLIDNKDPRWLGAWWLGWIILGFTMLLFSWLIGMFPKELPKMRLLRQSSEIPRVLRVTSDDDEAKPFKNNNEKTQEVETADNTVPLEDFPKLKDFPTALMRLLKNKLLIFNILSGIFYILGSSGYITFLSKYMEVQFNKSTSDATIVTGPVTIIGMVTGFLLSGYLISKYRPTPRVLFFWNVIVGAAYMVGQLIYMSLTCDNNSLINEFGALNLTASCNSGCSCDDVSYSPVCNEATGITYFSPCHAGCNVWDERKKEYSDCACSSNSDDFTRSPWFHSTDALVPENVDGVVETSTPLGFRVNLPNGHNSLDRLVGTVDIVTDSTYVSYTGHHKDDYEEIVLPETISNDDYSNQNETNDYLYVPTISSTDATTPTTLLDADEWTYTTDAVTTSAFDTATEGESRRKRAAEASERLSNATMIPGACLAGCAYGFYMFTAISCLINWLGATGRIGNILLNFRVVSTEDKSFSQGLALMMISLFALIPGPILYGYIIDSTCLKWNTKCGDRGNCQLYNQTTFRYYLNVTAMMLTSIGVFFDVLVWYYGQDVDLYGEKEDEKYKQLQRPNQTISPLVTNDKHA